MVIDEFLALASQRRSVREFTAWIPSDEQIHRLIEAACHAPSNNNRQAWKFIAVERAETREALGRQVQERIREISGQIQDAERAALIGEYSRHLTFFSTAPLVIAALYKSAPAFWESLQGEAGIPVEGFLIPAEGFSVAMAVQNLLLAAQAMGLGACCTTAPLIAVDRLREILKIPIGWEIAALIPVGEAAVAPVAPRKKPLEQMLQIVH